MAAKTQLAPRDLKPRFSGGEKSKWTFGLWSVCIQETLKSNAFFLELLLTLNIPCRSQ